ncbi:pyridine nucleotide-disulfide oxidoreductase-domain-containing protein [Apodospora peruviana]|uniref:Pyridine nucleotide-disulfide oxidoreductase-domain-containing protein n=1 Tax=Apodospora peruviana TaxID=516989 RepID=A0AAE0IT33_9PEZI|nr:pyridine nucleotide-disulfide oxidoreductase-domain-containing protein [Apodospora peruviana]
MHPLLIIRRQGCSSSNTLGKFKAGARALQWKRVELGALSRRHHHVSAIVVGAGPAGIAVVGNLLEQIKPGTTHGGQGQGRIAWIDPSFSGGRINRKYREVPSNTTAGLFLEYSKALDPFRQLCEAAPKPNAVTAVQDLPQDQTCSLHHAGDMLQLLTDGLVRHERVETCLGQVTGAKWDEATSTWSLDIKDWATKGAQVHRTAPLVVYCTGSSPTTITLPATSSQPRPKPLDLDTALKPSALARTLSPPLPKGSSKKDAQSLLTVGVIGASHSAILVLMNLFALQSKLAAAGASQQLRVRWFTRTPALKYAVHKDGWIMYDNTGLKGQAAQFAREQLDGDRLKSSEAGRVMQRVDCSGGQEKERNAFLRELPGCNYVVQAVGFTRDPLPPVITPNGSQKELEFDHETGGFTDKKTGEVVKGLFGAGIAFPERVVDREGNVEYAVGFWKFMRFLKRVVPTWVKKTL